MAEPVPDLCRSFGIPISGREAGLRGPCVQSASDDFSGAVAQLGERLICIQEVAGSIPTSSTSVSVVGRTGPVAQVARAHP
jgi:hypothetical protein